MRVVIFSDLWSSEVLKQELPGVRAFPFPLIETTPLLFKVPKQKFDWVLVTSKRTWKSLKLVKGLRTQGWLFIGKASYRSTKEPSITLKTEQNQNGILRFFLALKPQKIFYPRSSEGDRDLVRRLRKHGHRVIVRRAYETKERAISRADFQKFLKSAQPDALLFLSPSAVRSYRKLGGVFPKKGDRLKLLAWGPTTGRALKAYTACIRTLEKPQLASFRAALLEVKKER